MMIYSGGLQAGEPSTSTAPARGRTPAADPKVAAADGDTPRRVNSFFMCKPPPFSPAGRNCLKAARHRVGVPGRVGDLAELAQLVYSACSVRMSSEVDAPAVTPCALRTSSRPSP